MWNQCMLSRPRVHFVNLHLDIEECKCMISCSLYCSDPWSWTEDELRRLETPTDSFEIWQGKLLKAAAAYKGKENLVGSIARRLKTCLDRSGGATDD